MSRFNEFMPFIFKWECVYNKAGKVVSENDPSDPGGLTKYGVDQRSHPKVNIKDLTESQALDIYRLEYWDKNKIESMPAKLGEAYFNCCVNCGAGRAKKLLVGNDTPAKFILAQEGFYHRLAASNPKLKKFLKGWLNRTQDLRRFLKY